MATTQPTEIKKTDADFEKIKAGMALVTKNLIAYKKQKGTDLVVLRGDKIVRIKP